MAKAADPAVRGAARLKRFSSALAREPLLHFLLIGLILFGVLQLRRGADDLRRIVVTPAVVAQLQNDYRLQFGQAPTPATTEALVDQYVEETIYYRQGIALHLDRNDEVIRRRIVQKAEFLQQNLATLPPPADAEIEQFYHKNQARYTAPQKVSFSHIFFAGDDTQTQKRAEGVLATLRDSTARAPERGDNFPDLYDYVDFGHEQAERLFGSTQLTRALFAAPVGHWAGPFQSAYGWHLLRVQAQAAPAARPLSEVKDQVREDMMAQAQDNANRKTLDALKARFKIIREDQTKKPDAP